MREVYDGDRVATRVDGHIGTWRQSHLLSRCFAIRTAVLSLRRGGVDTEKQLKIRAIAAVAGAALMLLFIAPQRTSAIDLYDCDDFSTQFAAQAVLRADPTDPHNLDGKDDNGIACDDNPPPLDLNPIKAAIGPAATTTTLAVATTSTTAAAGASNMAQTGAAETAALVGLGLVAIGAGLAMRGRRADGQHFA